MTSFAVIKNTLNYQETKTVITEAAVFKRIIVAHRKFLISVQFQISVFPQTNLLTGPGEGVGSKYDSYSY